MATWWKVAVLDMLTGHDWYLHIPSSTQESAVKRVRSLRFAVGPIAPWTPVLDQTFRKARREARRLSRLAQMPVDGVDVNEGEVHEATFHGKSDPARRVRAIEIEADPIGRHFLLQAIAKDHPESRLRMLACWQWFAEWPLIRRQFVKQARSSGTTSLPSMLCPELLVRELRSAGFVERSVEVSRFADKIDEQCHVDE